MTGSVVVALCSLGLGVVVQLVVFIWWAATVTARVTALEGWRGSIGNLHNDVVELRVEVSALTREVGELRRNLGKVFDKLENKADREARGSQ